VSISKKKLLIIPSWYPSQANPIVGSFFREQAELVQDEYDIKVLHGRANVKGYKRYYFGKIFPFLRGDEAFDKNNLALTPPEAVNFSYPLIHGLDEKKNLDLMISYYHQQLSRLVSQGWKPDLIHAHSTANAGIIGAFLAKGYAIPLVITEHQVFLLHIYSKLIQKKIFHALEFADKVLAVSHHQMRCILMHSIKCNPVVVGNYINENLFTLKEAQKSRQFKILTITYPSPIKDNETFFKALSLMIQRGVRDISVTVIGNNSFHKLKDSNVGYFKHMTEKYGLSDYCTLIPFVAREDLPVYYQDHEVFVSTSIAETFGVSICEALATGIPVVSTLSGGVDDTLNDSNSIKVNIRDAEAIAEALIKIKAGDVKFNPEIVRNSVVKKFGKIAFKSRLQNVYDETISLKRSMG
jgi:glycosyltransferase involved in cell wall biosynthesis